MKKITIYIVMLLAIVMVGCNRTDISKVECGTLQLRPIEVDASTIIVDENGERQSVVTRDAAGDELLKTHIFTIDIRNTETEEVVQHYENHRDVPATIVLPTGKYLVEAYTANLNSQLPVGSTVGFDKPQYKGTQEVEIVANEVSPISVVAKPSTAALTISYSDTFLHLFPCSNEEETYSVMIYTSNGAEILFKKGETRTAYFLHTGQEMKFLSQVFVKRMNGEGVIEEFTTNEPTLLLPQDVEIKAGYQYNATITVEGN